MEVAAHYERGLKIATLLTGFLLPTDVFRCIWCLMIKPSILLAAIFTLTFGVSEGSAQQSRLLSAEQQVPYAAVGQLVRGRMKNDGLCTATLVAPNYILTAAHCLFVARNDTPSELRQYTFAAGWNNGTAIAASSLAEIIIPDTYSPMSDDGLRMLNNDWALARLSDPITEVEPLPITRIPGPWETVYYLTYSQRNREAPLLTRNCRHHVLEQGPLLIGCPVIGGNSGAAVLVGGQENPQIVAVIAAKADGNAFAVIPNEELLYLISSFN